LGFLGGPLQSGVFDGQAGAHLKDDHPLAMQSAV